MDGRAGCSVVSDDNCYRYRLADFNSIFTCEALAILKSLELIHNHNNVDKYIIYTDSKSCLTALQNWNNNNTLITEIKQKIVNMLKDNYKFELIWIPSHQGIVRNEKADNEARSAIYENQSTLLNKTTPVELRKYINSKIKINWDHYWKVNNNTKLLDVRKSIFDKSPSPFVCRKEQVIITRLRIGHTNMTHIHLITKTERNKCKCGLDLTVLHLLIECTAFVKEKEICKVPNNLSDCLNQDGYKKQYNF